MTTEAKAAVERLTAFSSALRREKAFINALMLSYNPLVSPGITFEIAVGRVCGDIDLVCKEVAECA